MTDAPKYRFECQIVDEATGAVVISDCCTLGTIDDFGGSEMTDMHAASMLRAFERRVRAKYERANYPVEHDEMRELREAEARLRARLA